MNDGWDTSNQAGEPTKSGRSITVQMHNVDIFFLNQTEECPKRCWVELSLIQYPDGDWTFPKDLTNRLVGAQHTGDDTETVWIEPGQEIPV
jgi:hypothetical protein